MIVLPINVHRWRDPMDGMILSLGYGDVIMTPSWKLLGRLEAADGALRFGVSTAMIFAVIVRLVQAKFEDLRN
jgi:hypothetical protein